MKTTRIHLETRVKGNYREVLNQFDLDLFQKLSPPGAGAEIIQFDGSHVGDIVHIRLKLFGLIKQDWVSEIIEEKDTGKAAWFVDKGVELPFFLTYWKHTHLVRAAGDQESIIVDDIEFQSPGIGQRGPLAIGLDGLLYPVLWAQFAYRRPIYRKFFGDPKK